MEMVGDKLRTLFSKLILITEELQDTEIGKIDITFGVCIYITNLRLFQISMHE